MRPLLGLGALALACASVPPFSGSGQHPPASSASTTLGSTCPAAAELVAASEALVAEGRLRRALANRARLGALCPGQPPTSNSAWNEAEAELAKPADDAIELMNRGFAEQQAGRRAAGRRLLDRALTQLERLTNASVRVAASPDPELLDSTELSPDGAFLTTTSWPSRDTIVRDAATRRIVAQVHALSAAVVKRGAAIAVPRADGAVEILSSKTGAVEQTLTGHGSAEPSVRTDASGQRLVVAGDRLVVWDLPSGRRVLDREGEHTFALSHDGRRIAYAREREVVVFSVEEQKELYRVHPRAIDRPSHLALSPDGALVAMAVDVDVSKTRLVTDIGRVILVHDAKTGKTTTLGQFPDALGFTPSDPPELLVTSRSEGRVWSARTGKARSLANKCEWVGVHAASGRALCKRSDALFLVDATGREQALVQAPLRRSASAALAARVARMAILHRAEESAKLRVFDLDRARSVLDVSLGGVTAMALSPDGTQVALGGSTGAELRDAQTGRTLLALAMPRSDSPDTDGVTQIEFRPDGQVLALATRSAASLVRTSTGEGIAELGAASRLSFSHDSKLLARGSLGTVGLHDAETGKPIREISVLERAFAVRELVFSGDSQRIYVSSGRAVREHHVVPGSAPRLLWFGEADGLALMPSGTLALSAGGLVRLVDPDERVRHLPIAADELASNQNGYLLSTSDRGELTLWRGGSAHEWVTLEATAPDGALIARGPGGEVEILDAAARERLRCQVGPVAHPLSLCEDELVTTGLLAALAPRRP
ncbi:MAG: PD40 domain-containing protein [Myxococcales bacterium]|nr:PD40 domain-containing protein [Myxococcales bacterium]